MLGRLISKGTLVRLDDDERPQETDTETLRSWCRDLWDIYCELDMAQDLTDMHAVMNQRRNIPDECVGLEKWALPDFKGVRQRQRHAMMKSLSQVARDKGILSRSSVRKQLRHTARQYSRTPRLFAAYVGRRVAASVKADQGGRVDQV